MVNATSEREREKPFFACVWHRKPDSPRFTPVPHANVATHLRSIPRVPREGSSFQGAVSLPPPLTITSTNTTDTSCSRTFLVKLSLHSSTRTHRRRAVDIATVRSPSCLPSAHSGETSFCSRRSEAARSQGEKQDNRSRRPTTPLLHRHLQHLTPNALLFPSFPPVTNAHTCVAVDYRKRHGTYPSLVSSIANYRMDDRSPFPATPFSV